MLSVCLNHRMLQGIPEPFSSYTGSKWSDTNYIITVELLRHVWSPCGIVSPNSSLHLMAPECQHGLAPSLLETPWFLSHAEDNRVHKGVAQTVNYFPHNQSHIDRACVRITAAAGQPLCARLACVSVDLHACVEQLCPTHLDIWCTYMQPLLCEELEVHTPVHVQGGTIQHTPVHDSWAKLVTEQCKAFQLWWSTQLENMFFVTDEDTCGQNVLQFAMFNNCIFCYMSFVQESVYPYHVVAISLYNITIRHVLRVACASTSLCKQQQNK